MGKSPGKWIKTLLFGKKSFKSSFSKGREKVGNEKEVWIAAKAPEADLALDPPVSSDLTQSIIQKYEGKVEDRIEAMNLPLEGRIPVPEKRDAHTQETTEQDAPKDPERIRQEHAATTAQAALRGYMARRAFWALKGIIRLQALVRGHFVRRQAVSTLHCMLGIVKLQAIVRGRKIRQYDIGVEVQKKCILVKPLDSELADPVEVNKSVQIAKLSANAYAHKLLASSPTAMPLHLHYDIGEPNSVLNWLECWSASRFWRPTPQPKRVPGPKSQKKQVNSLAVDTHTSRLKHSTRRAPAANADSASVHSTTEFEKPRRNLRKISRHSTDSVQENPQHELEKVKRSLRKVHNPIVQSAVQLEIEIEKSKQSLGKVLSSSGQDVLEQSMSDGAEKMKTDTAVTEAKLPCIERNPEPVAVNEAIELLQDVKTAAELQPVGNSGKDDKIPGTNGIDDNIPGTNEEDDKSPGTNGTNDKIPGTNGEFSFEDDLTINESQKSRQRTYFSAKQEHAENELQSRPMLPSYMATTQSAKAKLRGQGSPRLGQDVPEKHNLTRRHSLPSLTHSKTLPSPRAQRPVQATGKGGNRSDRSLLSSRDGIVKVNQAEWRR